MIVDAFAPLVDEVLPLFVDMITIMSGIVSSLIEAFMPLLKAVLKPITDIIKVLIPIFQRYMDTMAPLIDKLLPPIIDLFEKIIDSALMPLLETILPPLTDVVEGLGDMFLWLVNTVLKPLITTLTNVVDWFNKVLAFNNKEVNLKVTGPATSALSSTAIQAGRMAKGGVASMAGLSWVGEKGPELMSMPRGATVTPIPQHMRAENMFASGGGQKTQSGNYITINVNGGLDSSAAIGEAVVTAIRKYERTSGPVFVRA